MVKFTNFCGIFATVFMVATAITIASCSQDDDYDSNMYTLAEEMDTRSGGDPGGPDTTQIHPDTVGTIHEDGSGDCEYTICVRKGASILVNVSWGPYVMHDRKTNVQLTEQIVDEEHYVFRNVTNEHAWYGNSVQIKVKYKLYSKYNLIQNGDTIPREILIEDDEDTRTIYATNSHHAN